MSAEAERKQEHLRDHLTDGRWHDDCYWCGRRRVYGDTGLEDRVPEHGAEMEG